MVNILAELAALLGVSVFLIGVLFFWAIFWKAIALWRAGRNNHLGWFVVLFVFNTLGLLPILYLLFFQPRKKVITRKIRRHVSRV